MANPETPHEQDPINHRLEKLDADGILISDSLKEKIKKEPLILQKLEYMAEHLRGFVELQDKRITYSIGKKTWKKKLPITEADTNLIEGEVRRVNDVSEIAAKAKTMWLMVLKYNILWGALIVSKVRNNGAETGIFNTFTADELNKVNALPLEQAVSWMDLQTDRVNLLIDLMLKNVVPVKEYRKYRAMDVNDALQKLQKIKADNEKKEHASADSKLQDELSKLT